VNPPPWSQTITGRFREPLISGVHTYKRRQSSACRSVILYRRNRSSSVGAELSPWAGFPPLPCGQIGPKLSELRTPAQRTAFVAGTNLPGPQVGAPYGTPRNEWMPLWDEPRILPAVVSTTPLLEAAMTKLTGDAFAATVEVAGNLL
jgi:hypothetical protein